MLDRSKRIVRVGALVAVALLAVGSIAEAQRAGGGRSQGSRGDRTAAPPAATQTAPRPAAPVERTTQPGATAPRPATPGATAPAAAAQAAKPSLGRSLMMGLGAGLLGAGLFGLLSGSGLFGGLAGFASFLGLLLQVALIAGIVWLVVRLVRGRSAARGEPAMATAGGGPVNRGAMDNSIAARIGATGAAGAGVAAALPPPQIGPDDYAAFERALIDVQGAFGRGDVGMLRQIATPEMAAYFEEDLEEYRRKNWDNRVGEVKLLQGDLSEAWREPDAEFATVAMRYSILAATMDRATGRIVQGDPNKPEEVTEVWTFRRDGAGRKWVLSAIQQA